MPLGGGAALAAGDGLESGLDAQRQQHQRDAVIQLGDGFAGIAERLEGGKGVAAQAAGGVGPFLGGAGGGGELRIVLAGGADVGGPGVLPGGVGATVGFQETGAEILEFGHGASQSVAVLRSSAACTA